MHWTCVHRMLDGLFLDIHINNTITVDLKKMNESGTDELNKETVHFIFCPSLGLQLSDLGGMNSNDICAETSLQSGYHYERHGDDAHK